MTQGSPEGQEEAVRRLLAESGGPEPLPPDVAARLDATLARLAEEREDDEPEVETLALGAPTRRRWPKLLLAAAAVVVAGYGIGTVVENRSFSGENAATSSEGSGAAAQSAPETDHGPALKDQRVPDPQRLRLAGSVRLHSTELRGEVRRLLGRIGVANDARLPKEGDLTAGTKAFAPARCVPQELPRGSRWLPATYDGHRAVLVLGPARRAAGDHSVVATEVRSCSGRLLDSATVVVG